jgi:hypothetical protein
VNKGQLIKRVRSLTRDFSNSIFREEDIIMYLEEGIDRLKQVVGELEGMEYLEDLSDVPALLPSPYHPLLSAYATSRCFGQDERHYQATTFMNEFETKLGELKEAIESGRIVIKDSEGKEVTGSNPVDYVTVEYYDTRKEGETEEVIIIEKDIPRDIEYWSDLDRDGV